MEYGGGGTHSKTCAKRPGAERFGGGGIKAGAGDGSGLSTKRPFQITAGKGKLSKSRSVLMFFAAGASRAAVLACPEKKENLLGGAFHCAQRARLLSAERRLAVVGEADSAIGRGEFLSLIASRVYLIHRGKSFEHRNYLIDGRRANEKVEFVKPSMWWTNLYLRKKGYLVVLKQAQ